MLVMVESNETTDREKNREDRDSRVDAANLRAIKRLEKYFPKLQKTALDCGDIKVILDSGQTLAIERKRCNDFLGSIGNGRIFRQIEKMAKGADWSCLILEGTIRFNEDDMAVIPIYAKDDKTITGFEDTGWHGSSVRAAMWAIMFSGCPIIGIEPHGLANAIASVASFCTKPSEHSQMLGRHRYVTFPPVTIAEEIIAAFPGIGLKRSRSLLEFSKKKNDNEIATLGEAISWGTVLKLIDRKSRPEGWGDKTIENFCATLGLETGEFVTIQEDKQQTRKGRKNGK